MNCRQCKRRFRRVRTPSGEVRYGRYCSDRCKKAGAKTAQAGKPCFICETLIPATRRTAKTCSPECSHKNLLRLKKNFRERPAQIRKRRKYNRALWADPIARAKSQARAAAWAAINRPSAGRGMGRGNWSRPIITPEEAALRYEKWLAARRVQYAANKEHYHVRDRMRLPKINHRRRQQIAAFQIMHERGMIEPVSKVNSPHLTSGQVQTANRAMASIAWRVLKEAGVPFN